MSKYSGYNENDTHWDSYHKSRGELTNREFFSSNGPGGFYEGMEWDGENWVPNAENRRKEQEREDSRRCGGCGYSNKECRCD